MSHIKLDFKSHSSSSRSLGELLKKSSGVCREFKYVPRFIFISVTWPSWMCVHAIHRKQYSTCTWDTGPCNNRCSNTIFSFLIPEPASNSCIRLTLHGCDMVAVIGWAIEKNRCIWMVEIWLLSVFQAASSSQKFLLFRLTETLLRGLMNPVVPHWLCYSPSTQLRWHVVYHRLDHFRMCLIMWF